MTDRYSDRTFDPAMGSGSALIATFDAHRPAREVALTIEERQFFDNYEHRETRSLMAQRTGVCG